jgi:glycosyltransferase involved in cell wall biosynthesis
MPMPVNSLSVTVAITSGSYQKTLAESLFSAGMLRQVINFVPYLEIHEPNGDEHLERVKNFPAYTLSKRIVWGVWRRLPRKVRPRPPVEPTVWLADLLVSNWIAPSRIFHGCTALCLASLRAAKQRGATTLVEHAACHLRLWNDVEREECRRFGVNSRDGSGNHSERLLHRTEQEFEECDRIVVPSAVAQQSFMEHGYGKKTVVVPTGVDTEFFSPGPPLAPPPTFRVCCVGRVELAKGVGHLLQAWKRLGLARAELVLVGEVNPQMESLLRDYADCGIRLAGVLPPREVARCYRESSLFVLPSLIEGLAQVLLEAMASGLAVVATDRTGANDCMTDGKEGLVVPARNVDALAEAILWCYQHPKETRAMGKAARARIESQFTLEDYNQRVITLYRALAGAPQASLQRSDPRLLHKPNPTRPAPRSTPP